MVINDNCLVQLTIVTLLLYVKVLAHVTFAIREKLYTYIYYHLYSGLRTKKHFFLLWTEHTSLLFACSFMNSNVAVCLLVRTITKCYRKHNVTLLPCAGFIYPC